MMVAARATNIYSLSNIVDKLKEGQSDNLLWKRLESYKKSTHDLIVGFLPINYGGDSLRLLNSPIGPLLLENRDVGPLRDHILEDRKILSSDSIRALLPKFMVNQASRLLDLIDLICQYDSEKVTVTKEPPGTSYKIALEIEGKNYFLEKYQSQHNTTLKFGTLKEGSNQIELDKEEPHYEYKYESSLIGGKQYHDSGFDSGSALQSFNFFWDSSRPNILFQQGVRDNNPNQAKLRIKLPLEQYTEYASWYEDPSLKAIPVAKNDFLREGQYQYTKTA